MDPTYTRNGNRMVETRYWENGKVHSEKHYNSPNVPWDDDKLHREDGPAEIFYFKTGGISSATWYKDGQIYRKDGPARTVYLGFGIVSAEVWYQIAGLGPHREDGPAEIQYSTSTGNVDCLCWYWKGFYLFRVHNQHEFEKYKAEKIIEEIMLEV